MVVVVKQGVASHSNYIRGRVISRTEIQLLAKQIVQSGTRTCVVESTSMLDSFALESDAQTQCHAISSNRDPPAAATV